MLQCASAFSHSPLRAENDIVGRCGRVVASAEAVRRPSRTGRRRRLEQMERSDDSSFLGSVEETASVLMSGHKEEMSSVKKTGDRAADLEDVLEVQDWPRALQTAHSSLSDGLAIDPVSLNRLLCGACTHGHFRKAFALYNRLDDHGSLLDYRTFHFMIQFALKDRAYAYAIKMYRNMKESGHSLNPVSYCMLLTGLLHDKRKGSRSHAVAYGMWNEVKETGINVDAALFRAGCGVCVAVGRIKEAEALIPIMRQKGFRPDGRFYNILIKGHCQLKDMKAAFHCFKDMKSAEAVPSKTTYNTLIQGFVNSNQMEKAESVVNYAASEGCEPDAWSYTSLMKGFLKQGRMKDVDRLFTELKSRGGKPSEVTFGVLIDGHVRSGRMDLARAQFAAMLREGIRPNLIIYNTLLKGYASEGDGSKNAMMSLLGEMRENQIAPGVDTLNTILSKMTESHTDEGSVSALFQEMEKLGFLPDAVSYTFLLKAAQREGDIDQCRRIFSQMENSSSVQVDLVCWNLMVAIFSKSGDLDSAEEMLQGAVDFAQDRNVQMPVEAFGAIIHGYIRKQDLPSAIVKFRWFCKIGGQPDAAMLDLLLKTCILRTDVQHALKILRAAKLLGIQIDLAKYRALLDRSEKKNRRWSREDKQKKDDGLQTLKFWLGMPNKHYSSEWP